MPLLCFVEHPVCSSFKMYAVLILFFHYFVSQLFTQRECVKVNFLKFQVLRERTNVFVSFPKYPVYIDFEMFSALILGFLFWFDLPEHPVYNNFNNCNNLFMFCRASPKWMYRIQFSWNFRCSGKEAVILLRSWSDLYIAISKHLVS